MQNHRRVFPIIIILALFPALPAFAQQAGTTVALWSDRGDAAALDLLNGPGGKEHQPGISFKFISENKGGTSPKFEAEDENGVRWKVKLGHEAKSETAATRLVWAAGYNVDEDYYRPQIQVQGMKPLSRGQEYVSNGGIVHEARLERQNGEKKLSNWSWYKNPFIGTREFNGLRVMMALINNWDLKENNNDVYDASGAEGRHVISDLGASLGRTGNSFSRSRGVMKDYAETKFVKKVTPKDVDLVMHSRPFFLTIFNFPYYRNRTRMERVAKHIPIADARWIGNRLSRFSPEQIRDCFRAAGFSPEEVEGYATIVMQRIEALKKL
jgi:hypothetical protein